MKKTSIINKENHYQQCPFCESNLTKSPNECFQCGAQMFKNHINTLDRARISSIRLILFTITILITIVLLITIIDFYSIIIIFVFLLVLSWFSPLIFFKLKRKGNNVWRKKLMPW